MKSFLIGLSLILCFIHGIQSLKQDQYVQFIEDLLLDDEFVREYKKWTDKLFADPEYLGKELGAFPCQVPSEIIPKDQLTVHKLRPKDIDCVAGIGDSLTAGLGAEAKTAIGLMTEYRGVSWSMGGDESFDTVLSLPNILRQYNPNLKGFSTKTDLIFIGGQNATNNHLNVAKSGDTSLNILDQAKILLYRFNLKKDCDLIDDWKIITLFVGGNDLCVFCNEGDKHTPDNYAKNVEATLDFLYANFPRAFVNLVLTLDVRDVEKMNAGGLTCSLLHSNTCPCAAYPSDDDRVKLAEYIPLYHSKLLDLVNTGKYDQKDDFTVVVQPFMAHTELPLDDQGNPDYSYFAPDCFHFSTKGHGQAALSLWNNMLEPVGNKLWAWHMGEQIECQTLDRPYFATAKNSPQSFQTLPKLK